MKKLIFFTLFAVGIAVISPAIAGQDQLLLDQVHKSHALKAAASKDEKPSSTVDAPCRTGTAR